MYGCIFQSNLEELESTTNTPKIGGSGYIKENLIPQKNIFKELYLNIFSFVIL
jgi:hypothetical protein